MPADAHDARQNPLLVRAREAGLDATLFLQKRRYDLVEGYRLLRELVARYQPDVVCATGYKADVIAAWLDDMPTVATLRGWTARGCEGAPSSSGSTAGACGGTTPMTVVSKTLREAAIREGVAPARVFWVPNAIDLVQLPPPRLREDVCREIGADPKQPLVGAVGRLEPGERPPRPDRRLRSLCGAPAGCPARDRGDGPEEAALRRQAKDLGLSASVTFMGLRKDGQQIIGALDVMALPSFSEGMPNVVLEAFAYGMPVVATAVGGVPDMVGRSLRVGRAFRRSRLAGRGVDRDPSRSPRSRASCPPSPERPRAALHGWKTGRGVARSGERRRALVIDLGPEGEALT